MTRHSTPRKVESMRHKDKRTKVLKECNEARRGPK